MPKVTFISPNGKTVREVMARDGWTLLDVAHEYDIDIEGVCGGGMACSTCHVIVAEKFFEKLPPKSEDEEAILEYAPGLTPTSRLGCQIVMNDDLDGLVVQLPEETEDMFS